MKLVFLLHLVVWTMCCVHCKIWGMRFVCSKLTSVGHFLYPVDLAAAIHLGIKWDDKYYIEKHLAFFTFIYTFWTKCKLLVCLFVYLGFYVAFNTVQVISQQVVGRAEETSTYSWLGFCTVNCRPSKKLPAFPLTAMTGIEPQPQRF